MPISIAPRLLAADSTSKLQSYIDQAARNGDGLFLKPGDWKVSDVIRVPATDGFSLEAAPRAPIYLTNPKAECGLDIINTKDAAGVRTLRNIQIIGSQATEPDGTGTQVGIRVSNTTVFAAYGLSIYDAFVSNVSGPALEIKHAYGARVFGGWFQHSGVGIKCDGANGVSFFNPVCRYNYVGMIDPQTVFGGIVEGQIADGIQIEKQGHRTNLYGVYFEQNCARVAGSADIANRRADGRAVSLGINGCFFASSYGSNQRSFVAHNLKGPFNQLIVDGNARWFHATGPHYQFDIANSSVRDDAGTNAMEDCPNGFDPSIASNVQYART
jgi:hypothetical protein